MTVSLLEVAVDRRLKDLGELVGGAGQKKKKKTFIPSKFI